MAPLVRVGSTDFSPFVRWAERDHDFGQGRVSPQFGGSLAFNDGQPYVRDAAGNREWSFPLLLEPYGSALTNFVRNPNVAVDTTTWSTTPGFTNAGATLTRRVNSTPYIGQTHLEISTPGGAANEGGGSTIPGTFASGTTYRFFVAVRGANGGEAMRVVFGDTGGDVTSAAFAPTQDWALYGVNWTPSASRTSVTMNVSTSGTSAATVAIGAAMVIEGSANVPYFDGDSLDANWTGTPYASSSTALTGTDGLHQMVRDAQAALSQGAQLAFRPEGATNITYFDLETGELYPQWDLYFDNAGVLSSGLKLWTRPYGHTGTTRGVATIIPATYSPSAGPQVFKVTNVSGDIAAQANVALGPQGNQTATWYVAAFGFHRSPSAMPVRVPSVHFFADGAAASVFGASGAVGSQYMGFDLIPTAVAKTAFVRDYVQMTQDGLAGRSRAFLIYKNVVSPASTLKISAALIDGNSNETPFAGGATVVPTAVSASQWRVVDLGEVTIPATPSGAVLATHYVQLSYTGASGGTAIATHPVQINRIVYIPLGVAVGIQIATYSIPSTVTDFRSTPSAGVVHRSVGSVVYQQEMTGVRGGAPALPPNSVATGALTGVALHGAPDDFIGNYPVDVYVSVRERFSFLR